MRRGSKYPIFGVLVPKTIPLMDFGDQKAQILGSWTLWETASGFPALLLRARQPDAVLEQATGPGGDGDVGP